MAPIVGVTPSTLLSNAVQVASQNETTDLNLMEQLYTARGAQGSGYDGQTSEKMGVSPADWGQTALIEVFGLKNFYY